MSPLFPASRALRGLTLRHVRSMIDLSAAADARRGRLTGGCMPGPSLRALTAATGLALAACASSSPSAREPAMSTSASTTSPRRSLPAKVSWRSKDGQTHTAEIDIGELFADEVILHNVRREEMSDVVDGEYK